MQQVHTIGIADVKVVQHPEKIVIYDRVAKVGGMAHVILPSSAEGRGDRGKFADTAVDWLLEDAISAGCNKARLAAKIAGGASMFGPVTNTGLGERNAVAVKERLKHHSIRVVAEDVGGQSGRKMMLDPSTGDVQVQTIGAEPTIM